MTKINQSGIHEDFSAYYTILITTCCIAMQSLWSRHLSLPVGWRHGTSDAQDMFSVRNASRRLFTMVCSDHQPLHSLERAQKS